MSKRARHTPLVSVEIYAFKQDRVRVQHVFGVQYKSHWIEFPNRELQLDVLGAMNQHHQVDRVFISAPHHRLKGRWPETWESARFVDLMVRNVPEGLEKLQQPRVLTFHVKWRVPEKLLYHLPTSCVASVYAHRPLKRWPISLGVRPHVTVYWPSKSIHKPFVWHEGLRAYIRLGKLVTCGIASTTATPWTLFLTRGLYDPRLLVLIGSFIQMLVSPKNVEDGVQES